MSLLENLIDQYRNFVFFANIEIISKTFYGASENIRNFIISESNSYIGEHSSFLNYCRNYF